ATPRASRAAVPRPGRQGGDAGPAGAGRSSGSAEPDRAAWTDARAPRPLVSDLGPHRAQSPPGRAGVQMVLVMTAEMVAGGQRAQPRIVQAARAVLVGERRAVPMRQPGAEGEQLQ